MQRIAPGAARLRARLCPIADDNADGSPPHVRALPDDRGLPAPATDVDGCPTPLGSWLSLPLPLIQVDYWARTRGRGIGGRAQPRVMRGCMHANPELTRIARPS
jgi:hypothetical protein